MGNPVLTQEHTITEIVGGVADSVTLAIGQAPSAVTDLTSTPASTSVSLTWTHPAGATATVYRRDVTAGGSFVEVASGVSAGSYNDTGRTPGNEYQYKITLTNAFGVSADSNTVSATTLEASGALVVTGTIAHGQTVTITTDGTHNFGTRTNATPLYVYAGESSKNGSALGRTATNLFAASAAYDTGYAVGGYAGAMVFDHKASTDAVWGGLVIDTSKPLFVSGFRKRDFDMTDPLYQNSVNAFNLKTHRIWASTVGGTNNWYIGYQGAEGGNCRAVTEFIDGAPGRYYNANPTPFVYQNEVVAFINSDQNVTNGRFGHYLDNVLRNDPVAATTLTNSTEYPNLCNILFIDQVSNGSGDGVAEVNNAVVSLIVDDEPKQVWVGNGATIETSTNMYQIPSVAWGATEVQAYILEGSIEAASMYLYILTGWDLTTGEKTWASENGVRT